jgi:glucokinase
MILAGDVGGTNTRLGYFRIDNGRLSLVETEKFPSRAHAGLEEIVAKFRSTHGLVIERACFGVPGPVRDGRCETSNLAWTVDAHLLAKELALGSVSLINDLEANAYGIAALGPEDTVTLNPGTANAIGNGAIISAGTGLGEAGLYWDGQQHRPFASEGGHSDFAPRNALERELHDYLQQHPDDLGANRERGGDSSLTQEVHVSYERVLSGPGLVNIYKFLRDTGRGKEQAIIAEEMRQQDAAATISRAALAGRCALCQQSLNLFVSFYGAEAGNLALKIMATGGVWVGGGIAPKIVSWLKGSASGGPLPQPLPEAWRGELSPPSLLGKEARGLGEGVFMKAFTAKGRMQPLLEAMPVRVIVNDQAALLGCARYAATVK